MAERGRTRAFADLLVERQTGQQDSDPYTPVTVEHILDTVNSQRALVLYFSMAAGYLYSWLLAPGAGKDRLTAWPPAQAVNCLVPALIFCYSFSSLKTFFSPRCLQPYVLSQSNMVDRFRMSPFTEVK